MTILSFWRVDAAQMAGSAVAGKDDQ